MRKNGKGRKEKRLGRRGEGGGIWSRGERGEG